MGADPNPESYKNEFCLRLRACRLSYTLLSNVFTLTEKGTTKNQTRLYPRYEVLQISEETHRNCLKNRYGVLMLCPIDQELNIKVIDICSFYRYRNYFTYLHIDNRFFSFSTLTLLQRRAVSCIFKHYAKWPERIFSSSPSTQKRIP